MRMPCELPILMSNARHYRAAERPHQYDVNRASAAPVHVVVRQPAKACAASAFACYATDGIAAPAKGPSRSGCAADGHIETCASE
jgi:hypothetical protein